MTEYFLACVAGAVLDLIFGDPVWLYHPIRIIGNWIAFLEKGIRKLAGDSEKKLKIGGVVLWILTVIPAWGIPMLCLMLAGKVHPVLKLLLEVFWCGQIFAAKSLYQESMRVYHCLKRDRLEAARKAVARIVGRDTEALTAEGVAKAAVETVAENTSDGIIAPLFYLLIGGVPLGFAYKAVNTLDSMVGYKDDTYRAIGWASAKLDDLFNWIPARLSGLLMILAAFLLRLDGKGAWKIFKRDRRKHASPNSAQTESVCAGALGVRLAGDAWYFGKLYPKAYIGDEKRKVEAEDIKRANYLMFATEFLMFLLAAILLVGGLQVKFSIRERMAIQEEKEESQKATDQTLTFRDASGKDYRMKIDPSVEKHSYDWSYLSGDGREKEYSGDKNYRVKKGIDVSAYQGTIDWEKVKADGIDFVFLRLGYRGYAEEGTLNEDEKFEENLKGAKDAGLKVGVYFFSQATTKKEAEEEAAFVKKLLGKTKLDLPVIYDPERISAEEARTDEITGKDFTGFALAFCGKIEKAGYEAGIYSNMYWEAFEFDLAQLEEYPIWYADYEDTPQTPYRFTFWQYSEEGTVDGIDGPVDLDLWFQER